MIRASTAANAHLASSWIAGVTVAVLAIGVHGASQPLLPPFTQPLIKSDIGEDVMLESFDPPSTPEEVASESPQEGETPDIEIPPLPVLQPPLTPPAMVEITPLEQAPVPPPPVVKPPESKPPEAKSKPIASSPSKRTSQSSATGMGTDSTSGVPTTFTGGDKGRFPSPFYPAAARAAKQQGSVRLLVVVEASGLPSSVSIESSSGFTSLDSAARDHVSRRWRWPSGSVRRYLVPIRFVLQPSS